MSQEIQNFTKTKLKVAIVCPKKKPWVPPPARTTKSYKGVQGKTVLSLDQNYGLTTDVQSFVEEENSFSEDDYKLGSRNKDNRGDMENTNNFNTTEADSEPTDKEFVGVLPQELSSLGRTIQLLEHHFYSIQTFLLLLQRVLKLVLPDKEAVNDVVRKTEKCIEECNVAFFQIKSTYEMLEGRIIQDSERPEAYANLIKRKELIISKLLEGYENVASALQLVVRHIDRSGLTALNIEQDSLKKTVENLQSDYMSQEIHVQGLENELSLSQGQVSCLKMQKHALEDARSSLLKELTKRGAEIENLKIELQKFQLQDTGQRANDRLIEIMEELKLKFLSEKEALKKAIRMQKVRADQSEEIISRMTEKLQTKENMVYQIASERDEWKVKVTVASNKLVEAENEIASLKGQAQKLHHTLQEDDASHQCELSRLIGVLNEKALLLKELSRKNEDLTKSQVSLEERCSQTESELKDLQKKYDEMSDIFHAQHEKEKGAEVPSETDNLTALLKDLREQLVVAIKVNEHIIQEKNSNEHTLDKSAGNSLFFMIQDLKEQIRCAKEVFVQDKQKDAEIMLLKDQICALEEKFTIATGENLKLVARMEVDERKLPGKDFTGSTTDNRYQLGERNLNPNGKLSEAGQLLQKLAKNNEDFVKQIKELRDKLSKQEQLNEIKMSKLEHDLYARERELSAMKVKDKEEEEHRLQRMKDLQNSLNEANESNERLKTYVEFLKNSYINVFGKP